MDNKSLLKTELGVPERFVRDCSENRCVCLVHETWLRQVQTRCVPSSDTAVWESLTETECGVLLAASYATIPRPWARISIKVIPKNEKLVESFVEEPLGSSGLKLGHSLSELLSHVSAKNFRNMWDHTQQKHLNSQINPNGYHVTARQKAYTEVVRSVLTRLYRAPMINLSNTGKAKEAPSEEIPFGLQFHANILPAFVMYESDSAFFVVQPYVEYSVHDMVTFTSSSLAGSYTKPLFILYQVLHAMKNCHQMGLSVGDVHLRNLLVDEKFWVRLTQPHLRLICRDLDPIPPTVGEGTHSNTKNAAGHEEKTQNFYADYSFANLSNVMQQWVDGKITTFDYLMFLNHLTGRRMGDPNHHPILPWVMDFSKPNGGYRDLTRSKFRINKGDRQLDLTFDTSSPFPDSGDLAVENLQIPHHISDVLSDITYYVYTARRTPKSILCTHVRSKWVPNEYPSSMQRMQEWTPDECIPEFFTDPTIFTSLHEDLPDLELPPWAGTAEDFIETHMSVLEGEYVSQRLHHWIDLTFGYKLSGSAAVKAKNVCLQLVDQHSELLNHGVVQLFHHPHPPRRSHTTWVMCRQPRIRHANITSPVMDLQQWVVPGEDQDSHDPSGSTIDRNGPLSSHQLQGDSAEKKEQSDKKQKEQEPRPEDASILLPKGFDPLSMLEHVEAMHNFATRTAHSQVPDVPKSLGPRKDLPERIVARDMQAFGCLMVELFHSNKLRVLSPAAPLLTRFSLMRKLCNKMKDELPRPIRYAANILLHLNKQWSPEQVDHLTGALFKYNSISDRGLPPPTPFLFLHPQTNLIPFPVYFHSLYSVLSRLKVLEANIQDLENQGSASAERQVQIRNLAKEKVTLLMRYIHKAGPTLKNEGMELLLPYITELFENPMTSVHAAWSLFEPVSQVLGAQETCKRLLSHLTSLFDGEELTRKHMKLYHRSFVIQLLVRLGAGVFLLNFTTLLVEASAGYKNFSGDEVDRQISSEMDCFGNNGMTEEDYPSVFVDEAVLEQGEMTPLDVDKSLEEQNREVSLGEEVLPDDDLEVESDSGSAGLPSDAQSMDSTDQADVFAETSSIGSVNEPNEELLGRSLGRLSVHSVSRLLQEEHEKHAGASGDNLSVDDSEQQIDRRASVGSASISEIDQDEETGTDSKGEDAPPLPPPPTNLVRSETEEFTSAILDSGATDYNINHVAGETIKWLSHRLGPVLTAKWLSRNLLRMLALCYYGEEQLEPATKDVGYMMSTTNRPVTGDYNASQVLECLSCIAVLYGEHVILLQYFPHCRELIAQGQKKLTGRTEAGLICTLALINHIIPYLSDATLMDILQESVFKDLLLPLLKLVSSSHVSFPSGAKARTVICHKLIDALYIISLRIGFEMTRQNMTFVLLKFFAAFNRVYDENFLDNKRPGASPTSPQIADSSGDAPSSADNVYMEIKRDSVTGSYKIGAPVKPSSWQPGHQRQGSGGFRYSLSPASTEEREETDTKGVDSEAHIMEELRQTFSPQLANLAYIPFCKLAGGIYMEQNLINDDLIRKLCTMYDEAVSQQNAVAAAAAAAQREGGRLGSSNGDNQRTQSPTSDDDDVGGNFGRNVSVAGNKIMIAEDEGQSLDPQSGSTKQGRRRSGESVIDYNRLRSPEMDINKQRHLKGNWLAYWEHELGLSERETSFNFKQIKLQTFSGHTNSVRSLYILDNENSFISASKDKTVKLWSLRSFGDGAGRVGCQWTYNHHKKSVFSVTFLDSVRLAASCDSVVHVWDPFMGLGVRQFDSSRNPPVTVLTAMPAPHSTLVTATTDATLRFLDIRAASYVHEFKCSTGPAGLIRCTAVSPDGHWVAVGYSSGVISVIDLRTGLLLATWKGHEGEILQVKAYNNKSILTTSLDQSMTLWNVEEAKPICYFKGTTEPVHCVMFYRNEILSATTANRVGVHTSVDRKASFSSTRLRSDVFRGVLTTMAVLPQNRLLLLGADNGTIRLLA